MRYIVDGYNLIFRIFDTKWETLQEQREQVIPFLWDLFEGTNHRIEIVFDSNPEHFFSQNTRRNPPFYLLFSPPPLNADKFILELCHGVKTKGKTTVVSSDRHLILSVKELNIGTLSVEDFLSHFQQRKRRQKKEEKPQIHFSVEKLAHYRHIFEKRAHDPATFEDL
ncbi:MAG: NYN domain-containing protein [Chlamydiia bacterium]